jgi:hypothetical protein
MSKANLAHQVYPYLLCDLTIESANQVWCTGVQTLHIYLF